jgi:uncharacterized protein
VTLVADTSVVFAALDRNDPEHARCAELLSISPSVTLPAAVIVEVDWLARSRGIPRATDHLLASIDDRSVIVVDLDEEDYRRVRQLVWQYDDLPLSVVDAALVTVAERLEQTKLATLDHRHFSVVRPAHVPAFTLVP